MKTILTYKESQHLKELGVDPQLASVCAEDVPYDEEPEWGAPDMIDILESQCVFSLESLLSILPKRITDRRNIYSLTIEIADCLDGNDKWCISYRNMLDMDELDSFQSAEELIDAIYLMLCWLKSEDNKNLVWL